MNSDVFKGKWHQLKGDVKSQWGKLTDDDLDRVAGDAESLVGRVQERYGYARERAMQEVDDFFNRHVRPGPHALKDEVGAVGYIALWLLGVPASVLFLIFLLRGCN